MSTTVATKIAEIKLEIDVPSNITDAMILNWINQFEGSIYDDVKTYNPLYYRHFYYPRIKGQKEYTLGTGAIPASKDIINVHLWDNTTSEFVECKKIDNRSYKNDGYYYWFDNRYDGMSSPVPISKISKLWISKEPTQTDDVYGTFYVLKNALAELLGNLTFTSNTITTTQDNIDFTIGKYPDYETFDGFLPGMKVTIYGCDTAGANGEFYITNVEAKTLTFEGNPFISGMSNATVVICGGAFPSTNAIKLKEGDYFCIGQNSTNPNHYIGLQTSLISEMYWQGYYKCIGTYNNIISVPYNSLPRDGEMFNLYFKPGIRITYITPFTKKLIANVATDTLILDSKYEAAYNYMIKGEIYANQQEFSQAEYWFAKADAVMASFKNQYEKTAEDYPADNQIVAAW